MILITGAAGFIGFHVAQRLLRDGHGVFGVDNLNEYYEPTLKEARLRLLLPNRKFSFARVDISNKAAVAEIFAAKRPEYVVHLAAQAGVRYSLENPTAYVESNITGFLNVLEGCKQASVRHLVFASSSSVYGLNSTMPFSVHANVDHPISFYGATKKANELMAHCYSHIYKIPTTGLRFFTVYGPWGRPDMAYYSFARSILHGKPIDIYNDGRMKRDFTFIDDVVESVVRVLARPATPDKDWCATSPDPASSTAPFRLYNIGNHSPIELLRFLELLEGALGKKAIKRLLPAPPGDVVATMADVSELYREVGFEPSIPVEIGIRRFVDWYRTYYGT